MPSRDAKDRDALLINNSESAPWGARASSPASRVNIDRRAFLLFGAAAVLAGCQSTRALSTLPEVPWPERGYETPTPRTTNTAPDAAPAPSPGGTIIPGAQPRTTWTRSAPNFNDMNRMTPVQYITIHHDGMQPFFNDSEGGAKARLEAIRRAHTGQGWADIGYHFVVDRGGRIYEARPYAWQGAHVKDHNPGNIGIMALGNFEEQIPTNAQLAGVQRAVNALMTNYRLTAARVRTHKEWAITACPGRNLQARINVMRSRGWA